VRLLLRMGLVLAILLVLLGGAFVYLPAVGSYSRQALNYSVSKRVGGSVIGVGPCRKQARHRFRCQVADSEGSGGATYQVTVDGRCWKARMAHDYGHEGKLERRANGCLKWRDQLRLFDRNP
jgi:hypothetical protein